MRAAAAWAPLILAGLVLVSAAVPANALALGTPTVQGASGPMTVNATEILPACPERVPYLVKFNVTATGGYPPYTYLWSFGDGSSGSTSPTPQHVYNSTEAGTVTVNVTDAPGERVSAYLTVTGCSGPSSSQIGLEGFTAFVVLLVSVFVGLGIVLWLLAKGERDSREPPQRPAWEYENSGVGPVPPSKVEWRSKPKRSFWRRS